MKNTVSDNLKLQTLWRAAVNEEKTILGLEDWAQLHYPSLVGEPSCEPPLSWSPRIEALENDIVVIIKRLNYVEQNSIGAFAVASMIEKRLHEAFTRAAGTGEL